MTAEEANYLKNGGAKIVLTASPSEISDYGMCPFTAFISAFPSGILPRIFLKRWFSAPESDNGRALHAPYGLRKVESILLQEFDESDVAVVHPDNLHRFIGPNTKVLGISTMNPLGLAYVDTTYSSIIGFGGESINSKEFKRILNHPSVKRYKPKIIVGGSGAWQIDEARMRERLGIDTIVMGEAEDVILPLFKNAINGERLEPIIQGQRSSMTSIPVIRHASTYGGVEITRGCGRGCKFCSPTMRKKFSFPIEHIMKEVDVNIREGLEMIFTFTEDMFLYDSKKNFIPNRESVIKLYKSIAEHEGVRYIQLSHASLAPVVYDNHMIEELTQILIEKSMWKHNGIRYIPVEIGIETGSIRLMEKYMNGKALPYSVREWHEIVTQGIGVLNDHDWYPLCTIMTGMPDESDDDTLATLELLDKLKGAKMFFTPILFIPLKDCLLHNAHRVDLKHLTDAQWDFIATCWRYNVEFWRPEYRHLVTAVSTLLFLFYYRWKHGSKLTLPFMKFAGYPERFIKRRIKECEPKYCEERGIQDTTLKAR